MGNSLEERFPSFFCKGKRPVAWEVHCYDEVFPLGNFSVHFKDYNKFCDILYDYKNGVQSYTTYYEDGTSETMIKDCYE